ncbi:MAG: hypothetical protein GH154_03125 [Firmicutes bacterium]|nr:hypothetical protein [Bacillota bacterium]
MDIMKSILIGLVLLIFLSSAALAHKVNLFAYAEDGMVYTESYFSDGRKVMNSTVEVFDAKKNKLLLTGKTDNNGGFSFKIPQATALRIVLTASMGHKNDYLLSEDEVRDALGMVSASEESLPESVEKEKKETFPKSMTQIYDNQLKFLIEQAVEKKTAPIMRKLIKIEKQIQKPSLQEILGGIGYILGLMGIGIYFKYKSKC